MDSLPPPLYGVWLPGRGWLRGANDQTFGDHHREIAQEVARRLGDGAKVYFVDASLVDLESELLKAEANRNISFFARIHARLKVR